MKIYTKTGDKGLTTLFNGSRVSKTDFHVQAYGTVDECCAAIGCALTELKPGALHTELLAIQHMLFALGSHLATPRSTSRESAISRTPFPDHYSQELEGWIDAMELKLAPLKTFILPGGSKASAHLHVARTIARRAEREATKLLECHDIEEAAYIFMNRLSDYLFVAARFANHQLGVADVLHTTSKSG